MTVLEGPVITRRGVQTPTITHVPEYERTVGPIAVELAQRAGLTLDPWQQLVLEGSMGQREDGKWAAFESGLIVARQNGKGAVFEARVLAGLFLLDERLILFSAHEFKALDVATPVFTPSGWTTMGDLRDGDEVFAPDGQPTKVTAAHPVRHGRPCYRLRFDDGQEIVADEDHLWSVYDSTTRTRRVATTRQLVEDGVSRVEPRTGRDRRTFRFRVDVPAALVLPDADLPVAPWLYGAWLGDGTTAKGELTVGEDELDYITGRLAALDETWTIHPDGRNPRVLTVRIKGLAARLRGAGLLGKKRIPESYLAASEAQRCELLAGVMDTDGTVSGHRIAVTMVKRELMEDVLVLVRSLGYKATLREFRARLNGQDAGPMWRVAFTSSQAISPFGMPRKTAALKPREARTTRAHYNAIVAIDPVPSRPTRCITVAHESSCYLAGSGLVPTHNTAQEMFRRIEELIAGTSSFSRRVKRVSRSHGEEGIELTTGQRLRFVARSTGSGRGFSGDLNIWDEAQHLSNASVDALLPTMSARPNPQLFYGGSAPDRDLAPCEQIARVRRRALDGGRSARRLAYFEWSAELCTDLCAPGCTEHDDPSSPATWAKTNPGLGIRITEEHIETEHASMSHRGFSRERLSVGRYPSEGSGWDVISKEAWEATADEDSDPLDPVAFAVDVTPDRSASTIAVAGLREDGLLHVEVIAHRPGTDWVPGRLKALTDKHPSCAVAIDAGGPAGSLVAECEEKLEVELTLPKARDLAAATGWIFDAVVRPADADAEWASRLRHMPHAALTAALAGAARRPLGEAWAWDRRGTSVDISPLVAVTLAAWAFRSRPVDEGWTVPMVAWR